MTKTVEAPVYRYSCNSNAIIYIMQLSSLTTRQSFMTLWFSIMTSVLGISGGVYMSNHLQVLEVLPEEPQKPARPAVLEGVTIGVQPRAVPVEPSRLPPGLGTSKACPSLPPDLATIQHKSRLEP